MQTAEPPTPATHGIVQGRKVKRLRFKHGDWLEIQFIHNKRVSFCKWDEFKPDGPPPRETRKVWAYPARLTEALPTAKAEKGSVWYAVPVDDRAAPDHEDARLYNLWKCQNAGGIVTPCGEIILRVHSANLAFFAPTVPLELPQ